MASKGESPEFVGRAVAHLANDPKIMKKSGCVFMTYDLAREYGFKVSQATSRRVRELPDMKSASEGVIEKQT